ncbi:hypothetical protein CVIRNUC_007262 [Coccomyxa viridis]|uniref:Inositol polyphosphate-related phosphatase domain-containing protein n=1 Tax=Coccomyxa viridis TaxID=1274662 RepID=A0AAV1IAF3_9CHLO|nr:hypothetical protein CVIRNUC_007262 [Coccomyxa viridis]
MAEEESSLQDPVLSHLLRHVRPMSVRHKLADVDPQRYTAAHEVVLLIATFNVNGRPPPPQLDLTQWLRADAEANVLAVGFQEVVPLSAGNVVMGANLEAAAMWDALIRRALTDTTEDLEYQQVAAKQMVGLYLSVWVRSEMLPYIRGVQATSVGTGVMGYFGNKGAVAVRMRVYDTGISLVNCHLSSGQNEGDSLRRHADYAEIVRRGAFPPDGQSTDLDVSLAGAQADQVRTGVNAAGQWGEEHGIAVADHVFWMGDLNYRLNMPDGLARKLIQEDELEALCDGDELTQARRADLVFPGWLEGPLHFPPTYKFRRKTNQYVGTVEGPELSSASHLSAESFDSQSIGTASVASHLSEAATGAGAAQSGSPNRPEKEKLRTPAWTDRVLWRNREATLPQHSSSSTADAPARQLAYSSIDNIRFSDHRPVRALFSMQARELVRQRVDAEVEAARRDIDAHEIAQIPRAKLEPLYVNFGSVAKDAQQHITLTNCGQVPAKWSFIALPDFGEERESQPQSPFPAWVSVFPETGVIEPFAEQQLAVSVYAERARMAVQGQLSQREQQLDTILILQVSGGSDIFLSVTGSVDLS